MGGLCGHIRIFLLKAVLDGQCICCTSLSDIVLQHFAVDLFRLVGEDADLNGEAEGILEILFQNFLVMIDDDLFLDAAFCNDDRCCIAECGKLQRCEPQIHGCG